MRADLHMHSTVSDGTLSVAELVDAVHAAGVHVFALTDHDCIDGMEEARSRARALGIHHVTGVEISTRVEGAELHILGYGFDPEHQALKEALEQQREARQNRIPRIIERLNGLGIAITVEDVLRVSQAKAIGRPHVARALVELGVCIDTEDAFRRFLGDSAPAQVRKAVPGPEEAIRWIHEASGKAVWAHPLAKPIQRQGGVATLAAELKRAGLDGIEEIHPGQSPTGRKRIRQIAAELGLALTGGSDFHGGTTPSVRLGVGRGGDDVNANVLDALGIAV
jgi:predicted metal-dependent phosphoesterase TrpH